MSSKQQQAAFSGVVDEQCLQVPAIIVDSRLKKVKTLFQIGWFRDCAGM